MIYPKLANLIPKPNNCIKNKLGINTDLFVYQNKAMFNYSVDTILLANYLTLNAKTNKVLEIGTNNGALAIFLAARKKNMQIDAIEIQEEAAHLAAYNVQENQMNQQINVICADFNDYVQTYTKQAKQKYDAIVCNPPFYKASTLRLKTKNSQAINTAIYDDKLTFEQILAGCCKLIKEKGFLAMVVPVSRFVDLVTLMRAYRFEPKNIRFICPRINSRPILVLVQARFNAPWGVVFEPNLYLHHENKNDHSYRDEVLNLYVPIKYETN